MRISSNVRTLSPDTEMISGFVLTELKILLDLLLQECIMKQIRRQKTIRYFSAVLAAWMILTVLFAALPQTAPTAAAAADEGSLVDGTTLNGAKVRIRPTGSHKPLAVNEDGSGKQNCVHLYYQGKSSQFYLEQADEDSYYIYFYEHYYDANPKRSGDCRLDLEDKDGYGKEGQVIHVVSGNATAMNKRWQFIRQNDGSFYIRNKLTQKYWSLDDVSQPKTNNNKLVQRSAPLKWDIEFVCADNQDMYFRSYEDSRTFYVTDKYDNTVRVTSANWMGALPDGLKISDISIPGTHDAASAHLHEDQGTMSTQRYYIDELLNAGVRHLDIRTGLNKDTRTVRLVHSDCHALWPNGSEIRLDAALDTIISFLDFNPTETVIIQPKMDTEGDDCERATYNVLKEYALGRNGDHIWAGDHVPTLGEVRGKILVISRLNTDKIGGDRCYDIVKNGKTLQWALDCDKWNASNGKESDNKAAAHTASGDNFDVWAQDNYYHNDDAKKEYIESTLYGNQSDRYTNGTQYHYDQSKMQGKDAWILNYTSGSFKILFESWGKNALDLAKEIHQWLYDRSDYSQPDRLVCSDTFTGIMAFDFMDGLMAAKIYKTNFHRQYVTVHPVNAAGEAAGEPLVLQLGENEEAEKFRTKTTDRILEGQFNKGDRTLLPAHYTGSGLYLTQTPVTSQEALDRETAAFRSRAESGSVPDDLYVLVTTPVSQVEFTPETLVCGTRIGADGSPAPNVTVPENPYYRAAQTDGEPAIGWSADYTMITGGYGYFAEICLEPKFGFRFAETGTVIDTGSGRSNVWDPDQLFGTEDGEQRLRAEIGPIKAVHDPQRIDATEPTCEDAGIGAYYRCMGCGKKYSDQNCLFAVSDKALLIPALGHTAGEPVDENVLPASCTAAGSRDRVVYCGRCGEELSRTTVTEAATGHRWIVDEGTDADGWMRETTGTWIYETRVCAVCGAQETRQYEADHIHGTGPIGFSEEIPATCTQPGQNFYILCSCGAPFADGSDWTRPMTDEELIIPATGHTSMAPARENETPPTCAAPGGYDNVVRCEVCGEVLSSEYVTGNALGHDWGDPVYNVDWENGTVTAERVCARDGEHTETLTAQVTEVITKQPTCEEKGLKYFRAEFADEAFETQQSDVFEIAASGHLWDGGRVTKAPTCSAPGVRVFTCARCGDTTEEEIAADPAAHMTYTDEDDESNTATCTQTGTQTQRVICALCGEVLETRTIDAAPLGHLFGAPTYVWADDMTAVTATRVCLRDGCGETESETVETAASVMVEPGCETPGTVKYDAQFGNDAFDTQETTAETQALGHDWGEWKVTKQPTETEEGVETRVCRNDPSHTQTRPIDKLAPETKPEGDGLCQWCGEKHTGFWGSVVRFFHSILWFFAHLFRLR